MGMGLGVQRSRGLRRLRSYLRPPPALQRSRLSSVQLIQQVQARARPASR